MTSDQFEEHQRRHGFSQAPVAAPVAPEVIAKAETEAEMVIQGDIAAYLRLHEIEFIRPDMRKKSPLPPGWPDLTFAYRGVPIAMEVKTTAGKLSPDQVTMHPKLATNGWRVIVVRSVADVQVLFRSIDSEPRPTP